MAPPPAQLAFHLGLGFIRLPVLTALAWWGLFFSLSAHVLCGHSLPGRGMVRWHRIRRMPARRNSREDERTDFRLDDVQVQIDSIATCS